MKRFLENSKKIVDSINNWNTPLNIVLGNETCDLDSSICSICYAYYLQQKHPKNSYLPILNITKREFNHRPELQELLSYSNLNEIDIFTFRDQLDLSELVKKGQLQLTLVDHHVMKTEDEVDLRSAIVEILDHRPIVKHPGENVKYLIEPVGSCATLVCEVMLNNPTFELTKEIAILLYGVIIVDTVALSEKAGRAVTKDVQIVTQLKKFLPLYDDHQFYHKLHQIKISASNLSTLDLLNKDLKKLVSPETKFSIAFSVIMQKMEEIFCHSNILNDIRQFASQTHSSAVIIIFMNVPDQGDITRQLAIYAENDILRKQIARCLMECKEPDLELQLMDSGIDSNHIIAYNQVNIKASRKAILPIINDNMHTLEKL